MSNNKKEAAKTAKEETKNAAPAAANVEPMKAAAVVETPKEQPTPTETPTETKQPTARERMEEAKMQAAERKREIEAKQKELDKCLDELKRKKLLADHRTKFIEALAKLDEAEKLLTPEEFETKRMKLNLIEVHEGGYGSTREDFNFSISNSDLIMEFIAMLKEKINIKIEQIEADLVK